MTFASDKSVKKDSQGFYGALNPTLPQHVATKAYVDATYVGTGARLRLSATDDVNLTSTLHALQIGADTAVNLAVDANEIQARNNGAAAQAYVNNDGGDVTLGNASSTVHIPGSLGGSTETVLVPGYLRLLKGTDASLTSTTHAFQIGPDNGPNVIYDTNEIVSRDNGASDSFGINTDGGNVSIGSATSTINIPGTINVPLTGLPYRMASGSVSITPSGASTPTSASVSFPVGRFQTAPVVMVNVLTTVPGTTVLGCSANGITTTGCQITMTRTSVVATTVQWFAYGEA